MVVSSVLLFLRISFFQGVGNRSRTVLSRIFFREFFEALAPRLFRISGRCFKRHLRFHSRMNCATFSRGCFFPWKFEREFKDVFKIRLY